MSEFSRKEISVKLRWDWLKFSFMLHAASFACILWLWNREDRGSESNPILPISLTIIEIMLAILAIFLGIAAFAGFWMIKSSAETAARNEAKECIEKQLPGMLTSELVAEAIKGDAKIIPMIASAVDEANDNMELTSDDADEIASSVDGEGGAQ